MRHARRIGFAVLLALALAVSGSAGVFAHALLTSSDPAANAVLPVAPPSVTLTFTEPPDGRLSSVQVLDASGGPHATGPAAPGAAGANTLTVPVGVLADGVYTVAWRTVSAADGHATAGSFAFSVGSGGPPPAPSSAASGGASTVSMASVLARTAMYLGLIVLLGALFAGELLVDGRGRRLVRLRSLAWVVAALGATGILVAAAADAGVSIADALGSTLGSDGLLRLVPILLGGPLLLLAARRGPRGAAPRLASVVIAAALLADAVVSHAATTLIPPLNVALQWLHAIAISAWLGGLAGVLIELGDPDTQGRAALTARFSRWATAGILLVAVTGVARAAFELHAPGELVSTDYGRLIVAKTLLFAVLALLGAVNHFRHVPGGEDRIGGLRRVGALELAVGATVVVLASFLVTTAPPAAANAGVAAPAGAVIDGNDFGTTVRVHLAITPGVAGPNAFRATVADYDTGRTVDARSVTLRFALPARPDVGGSSLALSTIGDGSWTGTGSNLSIAGTWTVTVLVTEAATAVEVPLSVPVSAPAARVDVNRVAGQPTIYTAHLVGGESAQLYLDTPAGGKADLHVTFFDAAGNGLAATSIAVIAASGGASPAPIATSVLEPGHVVGKVAVQAGIPITVTVSGTTPGGTRLNLTLTMTPDQ